MFIWYAHASLICFNECGGYEVMSMLGSIPWYVNPFHCSEAMVYESFDIVLGIWDGYDNAMIW